MATRRVSTTTGGGARYSTWTGPPYNEEVGIWPTRADLLDEAHPVDSSPLLTLQGIVSKPENLFYSANDSSALRPFAKELLVDGFFLANCEEKFSLAKVLGFVEDCGQLIDDGGARGRMLGAPSW